MNEKHLPNEQINEEWKYADLEGYLAKIYRSLKILQKSKDLELSTLFYQISTNLNVICMNVCGREIDRAEQSPSLSMNQPILWYDEWGFYKLIESVNYFWQWFGYKEEDVDSLLFLRVSENIAAIGKYLRLIDETLVDLPNKQINRKAIILGKVLEMDLMLMSLKDILESGRLKQNPSNYCLENKEWILAFETIQKFFGFGTAFFILSEAERVPEGFWDNLTLAQWQEIARAAKPGTETARVAWENIRLKMIRK